MGRSAIEIATDAADATSMGRVASLFAPYDEGDTADRKVRWALISTLDDLNRRFDWQCQMRERVFGWKSVTECEVATVWRPADFLRFIPRTMHSRSTPLRFDGPADPGMWQDDVLHNSFMHPGMFRVAGNDLIIRPRLGVGHCIAYEYISSHVVNAADGAGKARPTADSDTFVFDDHMLTLGVIFQLRKNERLDYAVDQAAYETAVHGMIRMDGHRRVSDMTRSRQLRPMVPYVVSVAAPVAPEAGYAVDPSSVPPQAGYSVD